MLPKEPSDQVTALCILNDSRSQVSGESQGQGEAGERLGEKNDDTEEK